MGVRFTFSKQEGIDIGFDGFLLFYCPEAIWRTERKEELGFDGALRRQRRLSASLRIFEDIASDLSRDDDISWKNIRKIDENVLGKCFLSSC